MCELALASSLFSQEDEAAAFLVIGFGGALAKEFEFALSDGAEWFGGTAAAMRRTQTATARRFSSARA